MLWLGSVSLVGGVGLWLFPSPRYGPLWILGLVIIGSAFIAGSLVDGHRTKWKINRPFPWARIR
jgi:hypothetical protein